MKATTHTSYEERINRVCEFIYQNLDEDLSLDRLSEVAAFSKFHFHRLFAAYTGKNLNRFILLARLRRSSFQLAFEKDLKVIQIALRSGFESPEAFARAFKREFGQTPSGFRNQPQWPAWHSKFNFVLPTRSTKPMDVKVVNFAETPVAYIEHLGAPDRVLETAGKFIEWRKETGLSPVRSSRTFGVPFSDPNTTPAEEFRFHICGSIDGDVPENAYGVKLGSIPAARCAVVRHQGSHDAMDDSIYYLYRDWLPQSGEEYSDDFPCFFNWLNFVPEVEESELLTDIYLPLKG